MTLNADIAKTIKKQREEAAIEPAHAEFGPVRAYANWISGVKGENHLVVTIPAGSAAHGMGYRYVSIPAAELDHYLANGATLPAPPNTGCAGGTGKSLIEMLLEQELKIDMDKQG